MVYNIALQVAFKLNTVVNTCNVDEDMTTQINELNPVRWKVNNKRAVLHFLYRPILILILFIYFI